MTTSAAPIEIVLTGGPCSGKSTAVRYLVEHLAGRGWRALVVPEAATLLITGGIADIGDLSARDRPSYMAVQRGLIALQHRLREQYLAIAADLTQTRGDKVVVLYDRAEIDNAAYMTLPEFDTAVREATGLTPGEVGAQYDAVLHLVTAADGAPSSYSLANNEARTESLEAAVGLDRAVQQAWLGHPHFTVIANPAVGGFDAKLSRVLAAVLNILGEPEPIEDERKWLLADHPPANLLATCIPVDIEQAYLPAHDGEGGTMERRVRSRTHDGYTTYFHATKIDALDTDGRIERERRISAETYRMLADLRDPATAVIRKRRYCFVHAGQHFEMDHLIEPIDAWLLEAELVIAGEPVTLPPELADAVEVTNDPTWSNAQIARAHGSPAAA